MSGKNVTEVVLADADGIARAARILEDGGLVAVPTETVYGLAARADSAEAVAKIYAAKDRPDFNPLIVHVRDAEQAREFAVLEGEAGGIAELRWPDPITLVVPLRKGARLAKAVTAGLPTVAVRSPNNRTMQALLAQIEFPLAAPSANRSGSVSPTRAEHVLSTLDGKVDLILDDGCPTREGLESTILAIRDDGTWDELRPGPIDLDELHSWFQDMPAPKTPKPDQIEAPGQLASHYSPGKPIRLNVEFPEADEVYIGFGPMNCDISLSPIGRLQEAAANLYDCLHEAARNDLPRIAIAPVPDEGIGRAINDRLRRAATPPD